MLYFVIPHIYAVDECGGQGFWGWEKKEASSVFLCVPLASFACAPETSLFGGIPRHRCYQAQQLPELHINVIYW